MIRTAFLGTPEAAVPTLRLLAASTDLGLVITQPDRPRGRSGRPSAPPVKVAALEIGAKVEQPASDVELFEALAHAPGLDVAVVVAYGRIIRPDALAAPRMGMLNVHFSLLPRWRGAAPVHRALMAGDAMTGVSIIKLDKGLDTGPVLTAQAIDIHPAETAGELTGRLAVVGATLLGSVLESYVTGELIPVDQSDDGLVYASKIEKGDRAIGSAASAVDAVNLVRGLTPQPGAVLWIDGESHKVLRATIVDDEVAPGQWVTVSDSPVVGFPRGSIRLDRIQPPGRNEMAAADWLRGRASRSGSVR